MPNITIEEQEIIYVYRDMDLNVPQLNKLLKIYKRETRDNSIDCISCSQLARKVFKAHFYLWFDELGINDLVIPEISKPNHI